MTVKTELTALAERVETALTSLEAKQKEIGQFLSNANTNLQTHQKSLSAAVTKAQQDAANIESCADKVLKGTGKADSLDTQIEQSAEKAEKLLKNIENSSNSSYEYWSKISNYYKALFGYTEKKEIPLTNEEAASLDKGTYQTSPDGKPYKIKEEHIDGERDKINDLLDGLKSSIEEIKKQAADTNTEYTDIYESLKDKIEERLSWATSVALAEAYDKAKKKQEDSIEKWRNIFGLALMLMVITTTALYFIPVSPFYIRAESSNSLMQLLKIIPFEFPLIWLGLTANRKINQHTRLHEEYLHKWSVAMTYDGLRREAQRIDSEGEEDHTGILLQNFIDENKNNPSATIEGATDDSMLRLFIETVWGKKNKTVIQAVQDIFSASTADAPEKR